MQIETQTVQLKTEKEKKKRSREQRILTKNVNKRQDGEKSLIAG